MECNFAFGKLYFRPCENKEILKQDLYSVTLFQVAAFFMLYSAIITCFGISVYAASGESLTDVFKTDAFTGSWEVFSKFNWLGKIMNFIISSFSLIGLFLVCYQRLISMLYLSSRTTFDAVHDIKKAGKGTPILGIVGLFQDNIVKTSNGVGFDSIVSFGLSLLPDVKEYSDFAEDRRQYNLNENDTITTYLLKVSFPTIMTIFFFTIGFSGVLFQGYATVVEAMAVVADNFVNSNLDEYVDKMINSGSAYQFGFADDGTNAGKFRQRIAKDVYAKTLKYIDRPTTDSKQAIGKKVDEFVAENFKNEAISSLLGKDAGGKDRWKESVDGDEGVKNLMFTVTVNGKQNAYSSSDKVKELSDLSAGYVMSSPWGNKSYIHVTLQKKANSVEHNYFNVKGNNKNTSNSDGSSNQEATKK